MVTPAKPNRDLPIDPSIRQVLRALVEMLLAVRELVRPGAPIHNARPSAAGKVARFGGSLISAVQSLDNGLEPCFRLQVEAPQLETPPRPVEGAPTPAASTRRKRR